MGLLGGRRGDRQRRACRRAPRQPAPRSAAGPGGLADQLIAATILGCGALMLAGFAVNLGAAVWSATVVAVLDWVALPVWVLAWAGRWPGRDPSSPKPRARPGQAAEGKHEHENRIPRTRISAGV